MSRPRQAVIDRARGVAQQVAGGGDLRGAVGQAIGDLTGQLSGEKGESFTLNPDDFMAAREQGSSVGTLIEARSASLNEAGEIVNRSFSGKGPNGEPAHVISPVIIPKAGTAKVIIPLVILAGLGLVGLVVSGLPIEAGVLFGPHYWVVLVLAAAFLWWRRSVVMVPEGCRALITKFGKLVQVAEPGRVTLFNPWKRVSYIVNTTREYPFNAPIREAPTQQGVKASVDLFLQFRIEDPAEFIFVLGSVTGFQAKLQNAISEVTRSLIYAQRAEDIYDLVGESTLGMLENLNQQFLPAVRLTDVNITHAEPSSQEYRMDLAAPEMVRVAKEAYTYEYELQLRKEQNEGDLTKELAGLQETLSAIHAEIAGYQAQMDTALERASHQAKAQARQRLVEAESTANANAALLEAQALDIRALSAAEAPEILDYRFQTDLLDKLEGVAARLPQVVQVGDSGDIDFLELAKQLVGGRDATLFSSEDMAAIRARLSEIQRRITEREAEITSLLAAAATPAVQEVPPAPAPEPSGRHAFATRQDAVAPHAPGGDEPPYTAASIPSVEPR
ncbi:SPFH domain-containing protein [Spongiactinospora sp. TRM90649]|uniref:SPFH domain-containing protein n=1 Tax=Spongiactinospora sp. TRM90649 TaxID=3031114 RepID=UPI0023F7CB58|nr:SPFH domain-containing protein [Spongiactinospora sp. TRM90649]MDF5755953.1 SPFH domain-containing protein [Spongiactinospora sp. TRM90649]